MRQWCFGLCFFFSSRRRHTRCLSDWSSDVCSSDLAISWDPETGGMNWYFQYTPGDMWDYDEIGTHIMIDTDVAGQPRKLLSHSARNGHLYTMDRHNGQIIGAKPYTEVNWTRGIDQKTGKPVEY